MPHRYECPLRWADMDLLGHVNNVTYLDYVAEAREALFRGQPAGRAPVSRHQVDFVRPLEFRREPVLVDTSVAEIAADEVTLTHEVFDESRSQGQEPTRTTYLHATTVLAHRLSDRERSLLEGVDGPGVQTRSLAQGAGRVGDVYALTVRRSDLDERGRARPGIFFEYVQEARIHYLMQLHSREDRWTEHVVARTDVDYLGPLVHRAEPYAVHSWVSHLGNTSFTISSEIRDGVQPLARAAVVMVAFDLETQRPTEMAERQRDVLTREIDAEPAGGASRSLNPLPEAPSPAR